MNHQIINSQLVFDCGCHFDVVNDCIAFDPNMHSTKFNVNFECPSTYKTLSDGLTEGVFQLTSNLGHTFTKRLRPETIDHIAALGSVLRPACLDSKLEDGKSLTEHFVRRKNHEEDIPTFDPTIDKILEKTFGVMCYQEQSMEIVKQCAGFSLQEADSLRKAIGKKLPEEMHKNKLLFLEKAKEYKVLIDEKAVEIFNQIEAAQRYQFNASHSYSYGLTGYITAYIKTHFPVKYYKSWLKNEEKRDRYKLLINEAKLFEISVNTPDIRHLKGEFYNQGKNIYFGLLDIKDVRKADLEKLANLLSENGWASSQIGKEISWIEFLYRVLDNLSSKTVEGFIKCGALDCFGMDRAVMLYEYEKFRELTDKEKLIYDNQKHSNLLSFIAAVAEPYVKSYDAKLIKHEQDIEKREKNARIYKTELVEPKANQRLEKIEKLVGLLETPVYNIQDTVDSLVYAEEELLGVTLTRHMSDSIKVCAETHSCLEIANGYRGYATLRVKIDKANAYKCKGGASVGKYMCFLGISDNTYNLDNVVIFPNEYQENRHLLTKDNLLFVAGNLDKESFIIKRCYAIS